MQVSPRTEALTRLVLTLFKVNNATVLWGDRLVRPFGLTSARWQIMGAIAYAPAPRTVAELARDQEANRQNVQRIVNELAKDGLVAFAPNPRHKRAQLVRMTPHGHATYERALDAWYRAAQTLTDDLADVDLSQAGLALERLRTSLGPISDPTLGPRP